MLLDPGSLTIHVVLAQPSYCSPLSLFNVHTYYCVLRILDDRFHLFKLMRYVMRIPGGIRREMKCSKVGRLPHEGLLTTLLLKLAITIYCESLYAVDMSKVTSNRKIGWAHGRNVQYAWSIVISLFIQYLHSVSRWCVNLSGSAFGLPTCVSRHKQKCRT